MWFVRFQILMWEPQRIWLKLLVLSGLYALLENKRTQNENEIRLERLIQAKNYLKARTYYLQTNSALISAAITAKFSVTHVKISRENATATNSATAVSRVFLESLIVLC